MNALAAVTILASTVLAVASRSLQEQPSEALPQLLHSEVEAPNTLVKHGRDLLLEVVYGADELTTGVHCEIAGVLMIPIDCKYDVNNDGYLSVVDLIFMNELVLEYADITFLGLPIPTPPPKTDLNSDGTLQVSDLILLLNIMLYGEETSQNPFQQSYQGDICFAPEDVWDKQCFGAGASTPATLEGYDRIDGFVRIVDTNITSLNDLGFQGVKSIGKLLYIQSNDQLVSLEGLEQLTSVGGGIRIAFNEKLESVGALESLEYTSHLMVVRNTALCNEEPETLAYLLNKSVIDECCELSESDAYVYQNKDC